MSSIESEPSSGIVYLGLAEAATPFATFVAAGRDGAAGRTGLTGEAEEAVPIGEVSTLGVKDGSFFSPVGALSVKEVLLVATCVSALKAEVSRAGEEKLGVTGFLVEEKSSSGVLISVVSRSTERAVLVSPTLSSAAGRVKSRRVSVSKEEVRE